MGIESKLLLPVSRLYGVAAQVGNTALHAEHRAVNFLGHKQAIENALGAAATASREQQKSYEAVVLSQLPSSPSRPDLAL
jgi:hypothetical protein